MLSARLGARVTGRPKTFDCYRAALLTNKKHHMKTSNVSFQMAKALKQAGFNEPCVQYYGLDSGKLFGEEWTHRDTIAKTNTELSVESGKTCISAPTYDQAIDWLFKHSTRTNSLIIEAIDSIAEKLNPLPEGTFPSFEQCKTAKDRPNPFNGPLG